jgi:hypothetical protein
MVLEDLRVDEVSLVDRAANGRRFLIWKRNGGKHKMHDTIQAVADTATEKEEALISSVAKLEMSDDARSALTAAHRLLEGFADEIGEEALAAFAAASGIIVAAPVDDPAAVAEDELSDEVAADEAVIKTAEIEPILKAALDRIAELESVAKAAEAAAELTADVARCAEMFSVIPGADSDALGAMFFELRKVAPTSFATIDVLLSRAAKAFDAKTSGLLDEVGKASGVITGADTALGRLTQIAEERVAKGIEPNLAAAFVAAMSSNPDLAERQRSEHLSK